MRARSKRNCSTALFLHAKIFSKILCKIDELFQILLYNIYRGLFKAHKKRAKNLDKADKKEQGIG